MIRLDEDLKSLNIPVYFEGDAPEILPNEFFTIIEEYTSDNLNGDNKVLEHLYEFTLKWYTKDPEHLYSGLNEAITLLKSKSYLIEGVGYRNATYNKTWFSRQVEVAKIDYL